MSLATPCQLASRQEQPIPQNRGTPIVPGRLTTPLARWRKGTDLRGQAEKFRSEYAMEPITRETSGTGRAMLDQDERRDGLAINALDGERVDNLDDEALESFEELVRKHRTPLYRTALRLTDDWAAAEDLVQDTLERAYRAFHRYHPEGKARAWFGCIMRNLWISECRR